MRASIFPLLVCLPACGSDAGAVLTVVAPDGPASAARLEIILANSDPSTITHVDGQRVSPAGLEEEKVRYYRQRAEGGAIVDVTRLDGFVVRIEPNDDAADDRTFIPFMVAYDAADHVIGIGTIADEAGQPAAVEVREDLTTQYTVDMVALAAAGDATGIRVREVLEVDCGANDGAWPSGVAWRPSQGTQLRLMYPDAGADAKATDASARATDLDCDLHAATESDCDDLRGAFHTDRAELCDGIDSACDGPSQMIVECGQPACGRPSVQSCSDTSPPRTSTCMPDATCQCTNGVCVQCTLEFEATSDVGRQAPCAPSVGKIHLEGCSPDTPCVVTVVNQSGQPWHGQVGATQTGSFGSQVTLVAPEVWLRAKLEAADVTGTPAASVGMLYLDITGPYTRLLGVDLLLQQLASTACTPMQGTTNYWMSCTNP
jgi:hypothetical protein